MKLMSIPFVPLDPVPPIQFHGDPQSNPQLIAGYDDTTQLEKRLPELFSRELSFFEASMLTCVFFDAEETTGPTAARAGFIRKHGTQRDREVRAAHHFQRQSERKRLQILNGGGNRIFCQ